MTEHAALTERQIEYLLRPIQPDRVGTDPGGNSYLPQQDVRAHLNRVFGFGRWSSQVLSEDLVFEEPTRTVDKKTGEPKPGRFDCLYKARVRLEVRDQSGRHLAAYEDVATGDAQNQTRLAAHDLALKSAMSTALKRAATNLGDQFGLSLYNKGSVAPFVIWTSSQYEGKPENGAPPEVPAGTDEEEAAPAESDSQRIETTPTESAEDEAEREMARLHEERHRREQAREQMAADAAAGEPGDLQDRAPQTLDEVDRRRIEAEREIARLHEERHRRSLQRHATPIRNAQAHVWDAGKELWPDYTAEQRTREMDAALAAVGIRNRNNATAADLESLAKKWEDTHDDTIRVRWAQYGE